MQTFSVDDVTPVTDALPTRPIAELFPDALVVAGDRAVLEPDGVHPLLSAVAKAFAQHRPLVLTPDAVWLTIARGIAQHVKLHAEELRPLLVSHEGKKRLTVLIDGPMPVDAESWAHVVELFGKQIGDTTFECDFSTSTEIERMAGRVAMMDAYSPYYAYWAVCVCGIPSVTLTGTADDWRKIRARVDDLGVLGLGQWVRSLAPIMDEFVRAASGDARTEFWKRIYNPADAYGGEVVTGWISRFYPYLALQGTNGAPNPMLGLRLGEPRGERGPGIRTDTVPATLCRATVNVSDLDTHRVVALEAGLIGVVQDPDGALRPVAGWALVDAPTDIETVTDRLIAEHETTPPIEHPHGPSGAGEVIALYKRVGTASLFGGTWRLRPHDATTFLDCGPHTIYGRFALADGRYVGEVQVWSDAEPHWAVLRDGDDPAEVPLLGTSLAHLLDAAMDADGDIAHLETGKLADLELL
ncbi:DUF4419 domain-containing protein [Lentzea sp. NEAU-D7]|uniref:DUF4419 domain-containing protein n=1 Tax=Lentzea sp. NEAU-D7 TaxID=2994667 RepID=UPI00224AFB9F|nr:DUF4419 domain-containing protein [Lentzea sp. NEAU-D7]MCX2947419.1 DUF4419 domain-containing protein [Lentzea sp. NEAU-D7]